MILSFSITTKLAKERGTDDPLLTGIKLVSRRFWSETQAQRWIKAYSEGRVIHQAWSALPYVKGAERLGDFRLCCPPYPEKLEDMPAEDVPLEGGFWESKEHYINDVGGGDKQKIVYVVRWDAFFATPPSTPPYQLTLF